MSYSFDAMPVSAGEPLSFQPDGGLWWDVTSSAASSLLPQFYEAYERAFVLPDEKESLEGFRECLRLNEGEDYAKLRERYGPFRELILLARERVEGEIIGGANCIAFPIGPEAPLLSINLNYVFIEEPWRGKGHFRSILSGVKEAVNRMFRIADQDTQHLIFIEQNDPLKMGQSAYDLDTEYSGMDQAGRIEIWGKLGAKIVDFPYVQPPLSANQKPDRTLAFAVLGASGDEMDACLLRSHLERFFGISVLKGRDPMQDPTAAFQLEMLEGDCAAKRSIALLALPASLKAQLAQAIGSYRSLNDLLSAAPETGGAILDRRD